MDDSDSGSTRLPGHALGLGLNIVAAAFLFGFLGQWIGRRVGAEDVLTLLGGMLGAAAGFYSLYLHLIVRPRQDQEEKKPE